MNKNKEWLRFVCKRKYPVYALILLLSCLTTTVKMAEKLQNKSTLMTQAIMDNIRTDREILDDRSWEDFPIVPDYFYDSDEESEPEDDRREYSHNFEPLCQNVRKRVELRSDVYEYHPSHYVETSCRKFTSSGLSELSRSSFNQMCSQPGFSCVQRTRTLYLTRRRYDSDCWESTRERIASGCDCMWPGPLRTHRN